MRIRKKGWNENYKKKSKSKIILIPKLSWTKRNLIPINL